MKKYMLLAVMGVGLIAGSALATVGGPTYISTIAYKAADNSVYYVVNDNGGRGCPPIIHKINVTTGVDTAVKSCDQLEEEDVYSETGRQKYSQFITDIFNGLPYIGSVSLEKNKIDIQVKFVKEELMEGFDEPVWREFEATVTQDGKELGKINFRGCSLDQPHIFEGYVVPGSSVMLMLVSNKGDCIEGGYIKETIHVIKGVQYYDEEIVRGIKNAEPTEPNSGNIIAYASTETAATPNESGPGESTETKSNKSLYWILVVVLGLGLGYFFGHKRG